MWTDLFVMTGSALLLYSIWVYLRVNWINRPCKTEDDRDLELWIIMQSPSYCIMEWVAITWVVSGIAFLVEVLW